MGIGILFLRVLVGGAFAAHGLQKLRGWFGGGGIEGTTTMTTSTGMHPARPNAYVVALTETLGGAAVVAGVATPAATVGLTAAMVTAIRKVHWRNGFFASNGGWEFNAVLIAALAAITADGPGPISIDAAIGRRRWGIGTALIAVAAGIGASAAAIELGRRSAPSDADADSNAD